MSLFSAEEDLEMEARRRRYVQEHPEDRNALRHENARVTQNLILAVRDFPDVTLRELVEHSGRPAPWIRRTLRKAGIQLQRQTVAAAVKTKTRAASARQQEAVEKAQQTRIAQAQAQMFWRAQIEAQTKPLAEPAATVPAQPSRLVYQIRSDEQWQARMNPTRTRNARRKRPAAPAPENLTGQRI